MSWYFYILRKKYATFNGRASRLEFWMFGLFDALIYFIFLGVIYFTNNIAPELSKLLTIVLAIWTIGTFLPNVAIACRRLHDINRTGWWLLLNLLSFSRPALPHIINQSEILILFAIDLFGNLILLYFLLKKGSPGANRFGEAYQGKINEKRL